VLAVLVALAMQAPSPARAQAVAAADRETARALMHEGDALRDKRDWKGALERYLAADAIMHVSTTGLAVARAEVELGMLVEAHDVLIDLMRVAAKPNEPTPLSDARAAAQALSDDLEGRIPSVRVVPVGTATVTVTIDGAVIPPAAIIAYRRVNPGHHVVAARVGAVERHEDVVLIEREKRDVTLDLSAAPPVGAGTALREPTLPEPSSPSMSSETLPSGTGPYKPLAVVGFGLGAAGIVVGSITGVLSISKANAAKAVPASQGGCLNDQCGAGTHSDIDASEALGNISTAAFIAGGAGLVLGVTSLVLLVKRSQRSTGANAARPRQGSVSPCIGPLGGCVRGSF
jgi:hypothetical protein